MLDQAGFGRRRCSRLPACRLAFGETLKYRGTRRGAVALAGSVVDVILLLRHEQTA